MQGFLLAKVAAPFLNKSNVTVFLFQCEGCLGGQCHDGHIGKGRCVIGGRDAGGCDAGGCDAGGRDAGGRDAGGRDAGGRDASGRDAGDRDAGGCIAGGCDAGGGRRQCVCNCCHVVVAVILMILLSSMG